MPSSRRRLNPIPREDINEPDPVSADSSDENGSGEALEEISVPFSTELLAGQEQRAIFLGSIPTNQIGYYVSALYGFQLAIDCAIQDDDERPWLFIVLGGMHSSTISRNRIVDPRMHFTVRTITRAQWSSQTQQYSRPYHIHCYDDNVQRGYSDHTMLIFEQSVVQNIPEHTISAIRRALEQLYTFPAHGSDSDELELEYPE